MGTKAVLLMTSHGHTLKHRTRDIYLTMTFCRWRGSVFNTRWRASHPLPPSRGPQPGSQPCLATCRDVLVPSTHIRGESEQFRQVLCGGRHLLFSGMIWECSV